MYLWFAIQGQCVVVIPAILVSELIKNNMIAKNNLLHLELPTRPAQKCQPFGTCPRPPPAPRPYCCEGSLKLLLIIIHDWAIISCYLIEVFSCIHCGVASLIKIVIVSDHITLFIHHPLSFKESTMALSCLLELGGKGLSLQAFSPLRTAAAT